MAQRFFWLRRIRLILVVVMLNVMDVIGVSMPLPSGLASVAVGVVLSLTSPTAPLLLLTTTTTPATTTTIYSCSSSTESNLNRYDKVPVLEVIKIYGKLAGSECYGKQAPKGASCQINLTELQQTLSASLSSNEKTDGTAEENDRREDGTHRFMTNDEFRQRVETMEFAWPLKPYGRSSLPKTAVMNKGAETDVYMLELVQRGLYDPRNPTGPLPTSLRPTLNRVLQQEGMRSVGNQNNKDKDETTNDLIVDTRVIDRTYEILLPLMQQLDADRNSSRSEGNDAATPATTQFLDYYEFLKLYDPNTIAWPKY